MANALIVFASAATPAAPVRDTRAWANQSVGPGDPIKLATNVPIAEWLAEEVSANDKDCLVWFVEDGANWAVAAKKMTGLVAANFDITAVFIERPA